MLISTSSKHSNETLPLSEKTKSKSVEEIHTCFWIIRRHHNGFTVNECITRQFPAIKLTSQSNNPSVSARCEEFCKHSCSRKPTGGVEVTMENMSPKLCHYCFASKPHTQTSAPLLQTDANTYFTVLYFWREPVRQRAQCFALISIFMESLEIWMLYPHRQDAKLECLWLH